MRNLFLSLALVCSVAKADRPAMTGPPPEEEAVKELMEKVSKSCSSRDFRSFMDCFTSRKASSIKKNVEDSFICGKVDMEVLDFFIISYTEDEISFGARYLWDNGKSVKVLYCSKIVAKREDECWRIDSEQVRDASISSKTDYLAQNQNQPRKNCPDGRCNVPVGGGWRAPNPANGGEEAFLPKDILYMPGPSCANGNCRRR